MKATRTCSDPDCDRDARKRGMCDACYSRLLHRGEIELLPILTLADRLTAGLVRMPNGCLEWTRSGSRGYGTISINNAKMYTHRLAWELANGPIPPGVEVLHHCDNRPCCDAEKCLFLGTQADNVADMDAKGRRINNNSAKTHCPADHAYTEANTYVNPQGKRQCRTCHRIRYQNRMRLT